MTTHFQGFAATHNTLDFQVFALLQLADEKPMRFLRYLARARRRSRHRLAPRKAQLPLMWQRALEQRHLYSTVYVIHDEVLLEHAPAHTSEPRRKP